MLAVTLILSCSCNGMLVFGCLHVDLPIVREIDSEPTISIYYRSSINDSELTT